MTNPGRHRLLLPFLAVIALLFSSAAALAQPEQSAASGAAPAEKVEPPPEANKLLHKGGEIAITKTCGTLCCAAECLEGFRPSEASSCYTQGGECRDKEKDPGCTLTCKKGKEKKKGRRQVHGSLQVTRSSRAR